MGAGADVRATARAEPWRSAVELHRRADHGQQRDGRPPCLGPNAQGRLPALPRAARLRPALPERVRLPGALGRGRGRALAGPQLQARDRGLRPRRVRRALPRAGGRVLQGAHRPVQASRHVDGLGQQLLHLQRHQHRVHLALPEGVPPARLALQGPPLDRVVSRAAARRSPSTSSSAGEYTGARTPVPLRALPAQGARERGARGLDDDAVDVAGQCGRGGATGRGIRPRRPAASGVPARWPESPRWSPAPAARSSSGSSTRGRSTGCRRRRESCTASSPGTTSSLDEGTGIVHIAPGAGAEDFELSRVHDLPVLAPIDEAGRLRRGVRPLRGR